MTMRDLTNTIRRCILAILAASLVGCASVQSYATSNTNRIEVKVPVYRF